MARNLNSVKASTSIQIGEGGNTTRYFIQVDRVFRSNGKRGSAKEVRLESETVVVKENSQQGRVVYASPLEWLIDGEPMQR